tara:strand:+ start:18712 stop:19140 length:429 start_codon:yes stop_codon:yes gene_type:complete
MVSDKMIAIIDKLEKKGLKDESRFLDSLANIILEKSNNLPKVYVSGDYKSSLLYEKISHNGSGLFGCVNLIEAGDSILKQNIITFSSNDNSVESVSFYKMPNKLGGPKAWTIDLPVTNIGINDSVNLLIKEIKSNLAGKRND